MKDPDPRDNDFENYEEVVDDDEPMNSQGWLSGCDEDDDDAPDDYEPDFDMDDYEEVC